MTYSPVHVADGHRLSHLITTLRHDLTELEHMVSIYDDAVTMAGRRPDVDPDGTGRRATADPSRPTENIALDGARAALQDQLNTGAAHMTNAIAYVRGTVAAMDRALSVWEGEADHIPGDGTHDRTDGTALHAGAGGCPPGAVDDDRTAAPAPVGA